jgi:transcriptional regulator with XRE-family HTH domain
MGPLASLVGVSRVSVSAWRRGAVTPTPDNLSRLVRVLEEHPEPEPRTDHDRRIARYAERAARGLAIWSDDRAGPLPAPYMVA